MERTGSVEAVLDLVNAVHREGRRTLVAIAGPPGSGKSTIAAELVESLRRHNGAGYAALLPMDGFHLDNSELDARGLRARKGAPETFDVAGFVALVRRVRDHSASMAYPLFDRVLDQTVPGAGHLAADTPIVVFEGNYLLLDRAGWSELAPLFDATVMLSVPLKVLRQRLVDRWLHHGLSQAEAKARADGNDLVNARTVLECSAEADLTLKLPDPDSASLLGADSPSKGRRCSRRDSREV